MKGFIPSSSELISSSCFVIQYGFNPTSSVRYLGSLVAAIATNDIRRKFFLSDGELAQRLGSLYKHCETCLLNQTHSGRLVGGM